MPNSSALEAPSGSDKWGHEQVAPSSQSPGRLIAVTATGPVYLGIRSYVPLPFGSAFALLRELALRVDNPEAQVTSSLANRVRGADAYKAWIELSTEISSLLVLATSRGKLAFLRNVLAYVRQSGAEGLEPMIAAAVNAAWPWLPLATTDNVLEFAADVLKQSGFANRHAVPVVDASNRTLSMLGRGELASINLSEWRAGRSLLGDETISGIQGVGPEANVIATETSKLVDRLFGGGDEESLSAQAGSLTSGDDQSGVPGGLPSLGDIPGGKGNRSGGKQGGLDALVDGLRPNQGASNVPGGLPSKRDIPGVDRRNSVGRGGGLVDDLLATVPGSEYRDTSGFVHRRGNGGFAAGGFSGATPGGPFAPTGKLGPNNEGGFDHDAERDIVTGLSIASAVVLAVVLAPAAVAAAPVVAISAAAVGAFAAGFFVGMGIAEGTAKPAPPKGKAHDGDLYPDPWGGTGGGNPNQLPDREGVGGGHPNSLPDGFGGGGTPNTIFGPDDGGTSIWDDNFGRPGPSVRPASFEVQQLLGPGLKASIFQVGRATVSF